MKTGGCPTSPKATRSFRAKMELLSCGRKGNGTWRNWASAASKARRPRAAVKDKEEDAVDNYNTAEVTLQQLKVFTSGTKATILRRQRRHPMWIQTESAAEAIPNGSRRGGRQRTNWPKRIRPTSRKRFSVAISCKRPVYSLVTLCPTTTRVRRPKAAAATRNVYISKLLPMYTVSARADIYRGREV